jgi:hypothetical protein
MPANDEYYNEVVQDLLEIELAGFDLAEQRLYLFESAVLEAKGDRWNSSIARELRRLTRAYRIYGNAFSMAVQTLHIAGWRAVARQNQIHLVLYSNFARCTPNPGYCAAGA